MGSQIWTYEKCYELAASCKTRGEMKAKSNWAYSKARKAGWIQDYTWLKIVTRKCSGYWNDYDRCKIEAAKYQSITEFAKVCPAGIAQARKNNWLYDFLSHRQNPKVTGMIMSDVIILPRNVKQDRNLHGLIRRHIALHVKINGSTPLIG